MVSTLPVYNTSVLRMVAQSVPGQLYKQAQQLSVPPPSCIPLYNEKMGGINTVGFFM